LEASLSELGDQRSIQETPAARSDCEALFAQPTLAVQRRTALRTAGLLALASAGAAALAGCSADAESGSPSDAPATTPAAQETPAPASPSPTAQATSPTSSASKTAKAPKGPSVAASKVPVGGGVILQDADYVVTQPSKGKYKAFSKICTHQGCPVAAVRNGVIHCDCHGSEYSIKDGSVTNPPAPKSLAEAKTTVFEGKVYVTS
jgi:Rieske Fe-S protein